MPTVLVVRHGETVLNQGTERHRGFIDVPLAEKGKQEAQVVAARLAQLPITSIFSSDLQRASDTANTISASTQAPVHTDPRMRTWNMGFLAGQPVKLTKDLFHFFLSHAQFPVPQGESYEDFLNRWGQAFGEVWQGIQRDPNQLPVIVTHHSNVLAIKRLFGQKPDSEKEYPPGSLTRVTSTEKGVEIECLD